MKKNKSEQSGFNEILLYNTPNGGVKVEIYLKDETVWLTQQKISDLFGVDRTVVTKHIGNIFKSGELDEKVVCAILHTPLRTALSKEKHMKRLHGITTLLLLISFSFFLFRRNYRKCVLSITKR